LWCGASNVKQQLQLSEENNAMHCNSKLGFLFLVGALLFVPRVSRAEEKLTWENAAKEAARGNADLRAAEEAVAKAKSQVGAAFSPFLPTVVGTASLSHGNSSSASGSVPGSGTGSGTGTAFGVISTSNQYSLGLTATQNLFNGLQDSASLAQARSSLVGAEAALRLAKANLHQGLKKAFFNLLYHQQALVLAQKIEKRRKNNFQLVELRFVGGRENKGSSLKSRGQWRQAQFAVKQTRRNILIAQQQLAIFMGWRDFENITAAGSLSTKRLPEGVEDSRELARTTPSVQQSEAEVKSAEAASQGALGAMLPTLSMTGSISKVGLSFPPDTDRWSVGVNLTIPIFKYSNIAALSGVHADERRAQASLDQADRQAAVTLSTALTALQLAVENVDIAIEVRDAAETRAEIARSQYGTGLCSYNDWDLIETELIAQEQALLSAKQSAVNSEADWEQALGRGDIP
jgi:outer membrane protein